jgi:translation initiation factor 1
MNYIYWSLFFRIKKFMDLQDQLKNLFPDHVESNEPEEIQEQEHILYVQKEPMICKFEKRKGKATTIIEGYEGSDEDFKILAKEIKTKLSVGGTFKDDSIIIQGDYRDKIMAILKEKGFKTKRVGG